MRYSQLAVLLTCLIKSYSSPLWLQQIWTPQTTMVCQISRFKSCHYKKVESFISYNNILYIYIFGSLWLFLSIFLSISISVFGSRGMPLRSLCLRPWWSRRFASCSFSRMLRRHWSSGLSKQPIGFTGWTLGPWWSLSINIFCTGIFMLQTTHTSHSACFANREIHVW